MLMVGLFLMIVRKKISFHDIPNERSSHSSSTPRGGGIVFVILWATIVFVTFFNLNISLNVFFAFLFSILVGITGFLDDRFHLCISTRFIMYLFSAIMAAIFLKGIPELHLGIITLKLGWMGYPLSVLGLIWSINLFNFMDGIDGIATLEALTVFIFGGWFFYHSGGYEFAKLSWILCCILFGFFVWNFPPAKLFMGDVGSAFLGFLVILFSIIGENLFNISAVLWMMLYGIFCFDSTVTLIRRMIHNEKWYLPHRMHAYQRLQLCGWSHRKILFWMSVLNLCICLLTLIAFYKRILILPLTGVEIILLVVIYIIIEKMQPMYH